MKTWTIIVDITPGLIVGPQPVVEIAKSKTDGIWVGQSGANPWVQVWWRDGTTTSLIDVAHALVVGTRVQVTVTYDGTTVRTYVNGDAGTTVAVASKECIGPDCRWTVFGASTLLSAGGYTGTIHDARLMELALTAADLASFFGYTFALQYPLPGFVIDYFGDDILPISGKRLPGESVEVFNGVTSLGYATYPSATTWELAYSTTLADIGAASISAVGSVSGTSVVVNGTITDNLALYPGLLSIFDPSQAYAGVGTWGYETNTQPVLVNGDMEAATGWVAGANAVITYQATDPHGGTRRLQIQTVGNPFAYVYQNILIIGNHYTVPVWGHGDGAATQMTATLGGANLFLSGTGTAWVGGTASGTAGAAAFRLYASGVDGGFAYADDIGPLVNDSLKTVYPRGGTVGGTWAQATAANMPWLASAAEWINGIPAVRFDGAADRFVSNQAAASWAPIHKQTGGVVCAIFVPALLGGGMYLCATGTGPGVNLLVLAGGNVRGYVRTDAAVVVTQPVSAAILVNTKHAATFYFKDALAALALDGDVPATDVCGVCSVNDPIQPMNIGMYNTLGTNPWNGTIGLLVFAAGAAAVARAPKLHAWARQRANV